MSSPLDTKLFSYRDVIAIIGRNLKINEKGKGKIQSSEFLQEMTVLGIGRLPELLEVEEIKIILSNK